MLLPARVLVGGVLLALHACGAQWRKWAGGRRLGEAEDSRTLTVGQLYRGAPPGGGGERSPRESAARRGPEEAKSEVTPSPEEQCVWGATVAGSGESRRILGGPERGCMSWRRRTRAGAKSLSLWRIF